MARTKVFRDPIHKNIQFDKTYEPDALAIRLLGTPQVQRLRHIRQLALANNVYHGAEHSRFSHTLGVAHLAREMYRSAALNSGKATDEGDLVIVTAAALLHDVGHPPFSHAVEQILGVNHEDLTVRSIEGDTPVRELLFEYGGNELIAAISAHVLGASDAPTAAIISSQLDADRMDYVLRDGYHAGIPNAQYDADRILQLVGFDDTGLVFDERATIAIEGYFVARYHLYLQLYYHRTNRAAEVILRSTLNRARVLATEGIDLGVDATLSKLFTDHATDAALLLTDHDLWAAFRAWESHPDPILSDLARRLLYRDLLKSIDVPAAEVSRLYEQKPTIDELCRNAGFDPTYYSVIDRARDNPYKVVDVTAGDDAQISIRMVDQFGSPYSLENRSGVIQALQDAAYQKFRICIPAEVRDEVLKQLTR